MCSDNKILLLLIAFLFLCPVVKANQNIGRSSGPVPNRPIGPVRSPQWVLGEDETLIAQSDGGEVSSPVNSPSPPTFDKDKILGGPNPYSNVRDYGAYATFSTTTCTTISGSPSVILGKASNFKNGEYATCYNAGSSPTVSTPSAPTVTPSVHAGGMTATTNSTGSTSYAYEIVAEDKYNGRTAASSAGSTSRGAATLGLIGTTLTGCTRSVKIVTCTASSSVGFVPGMQIWVYDAVDPSFNGNWVTTTGTNGNIVAFLSGYDTTNGATRSTTFSGTAGNGYNVWGWLMNRVSWTHDSNSFRHHIYGPNCPTTCKWMGQTVLDFWDDFGITMMANQTRPAYIPATAPSSSANQHFTFLISSGGGTTTLTASTTAGASVSSNTIVSDAGPAIVAAVKAAESSPYGRTNNVLIPNTSSPLGGWQVNSFTDLSGILPSPHIVLNGATLTLNNTLSSPSKIEGIGSMGSHSFSWGAFPNITGTGYPLLFDALSIAYLALTTNVSNGGLVMYYQNAVNTSYDHTYWSSCGAGCSSTGDYIGQSILFQTVGSGATGFQNNFDYATFSAGVGGSDIPGSSPVPTVVFMNSPGTGSAGMGAGEFTNIWFQNRGSIDLDFSVPLGGVGITVINGWSQDANESSIQISGPFSGNLGASIRLTDCLVADFSTPFMTVFGSGLSGLVQMQNVSGNNHTSAITGNPVMIFAVNSGPAQGLGANDSGIIFNFTHNKINNPINLGINASLFTGGNTQPAAPTCATITAGPPYYAAGTWYAAYAPVYPNGGMGMPSALSNACTLNGTSQELQVAIPAPIPGASGYMYYAAYTSSGSLYTYAGCRPLTSLTAVYNSYCGQGANAFPTGGPTGIGNANIWSQAFTLGATPAPTGSTHLTQLYMDSTANWPSFKPNGNTAYVIPGISGSIVNGHNLCASGTSGAYVDCLATQTIARGTSTLPTGPIAARACAAVVTTPATGVTTTDAISYSFNAAPSGAYTAGLLIQSYVVPDKVNFLVCNTSAGSLTPPAATLNWRVSR